MNINEMQDQSAYTTASYYIVCRLSVSEHAFTSHHLLAVTFDLGVLALIIIIYDEMVTYSCCWTVSVSVSAK